MRRTAKPLFVAAILFVASSGLPASVLAQGANPGASDAAPPASATNPPPLDAAPSRSPTPQPAPATGAAPAVPAATVTPAPSPPPPSPGGAAPPVQPAEPAAPLTLAPSTAPTPPAKIIWQVEGRFRLWDALAAQPVSSDDLDALLTHIGGPAAAEVVHDRTAAFLKKYSSLRALAHWDANTDQYRLDYLYPNSYRVRVWVADPAAAPPGAMCHWSAALATGATVSVLPANTPCAFTADIVLPALPAGGSQSATVRVTFESASGLGQATRSIAVPDRLIVSLGDSFGSGEGNPDLPAGLASLGPAMQFPWNDGWHNRWLGRDTMARVSAPQWWDEACHRSFRSQHLIAALKYAADRPTEAVTFISFACSGAAIFDGLLTAQSQPPGYSDDATAPKPQLAQIEALARNLCPPSAEGTSTAISLNQPLTYREETANFFGQLFHQGVTHTAQAYTCAQGRQRRPVDALLVSVGGNDVGFARIITFVMLPQSLPGPTDNVELALLKNLMGASPGSAGDAIGRQLPDALAQLDRRIAEVLPEHPKTLQSAYPSPVRNDHSAYCGPPNKAALAGPEASAARLAALYGLWPGDTDPSGLRFSIDQRDGETVDRVVIQFLNQKLEENARSANWRFIDSFEPVFTTRGWCAGVSEADSLPNWDVSQNDWIQWRPADWDPYVRRARLFRTPNDSALTQAQPNPRPFLPFNFALRQEGLIASLAGSFHPTFEAHVILGLALASQLEVDLPPR